MRIVRQNATKERVPTAAFAITTMTVATICAFVTSAQLVISPLIQLTLRDFALSVKKIGTRAKWILPMRVLTIVLRMV